MTWLETAGDDDVITRKQLAESLHITTRTLSSYIAKGRIPPPVDPLAGKHIFLVGAVRDYLRRGTQRAIKAVKAA